MYKTSFLVVTHYVILFSDLNSPPNRGGEFSWTSKSTTEQPRSWLANLPRFSIREEPDVTHAGRSGVVAAAACRRASYGTRTPGRRQIATTSSRIIKVRPWPWLRAALILKKICWSITARRSYVAPTHLALPGYLAGSIAAPRPSGLHHRAPATFTCTIFATTPSHRSQTSAAR